MFKDPYDQDFCIFKFIYYLFDQKITVNFGGVSIKKTVFGNRRIT